MSVKDVLILTGGQEEHHYVARAVRDVLEEESGTEIRVEVREVGQGGREGVGQGGGIKNIEFIINDCC